MGRNSDCTPNDCPGLPTRFDEIAWPLTMVTSGIMPCASLILLNTVLGRPAVGRLFTSRAPAGIGIRGGRSWVATTTFEVGPTEPEEAFIATRTKAAMTRRARTIPRIVKGLLDVMLRNADPS